MKATLLIFFLVTGILVGFQFKQRHDLAACTQHENARRAPRLSFTPAWIAPLARVRRYVKEERVRELGKCKHALTPCPAITEIGV